MRAGTCQAIEARGQPCHRFAEYYAPCTYSLCFTYCLCVQINPKITQFSCSLAGHWHSCSTSFAQHSADHLRKKHANGTDTLPCHLAALPAELRLMVYREIFPKVINSSIDVRGAILKVDRQTNADASSVLYGESTFHAQVSPDGILLQGKSRQRPAHFMSRERVQGGVLRQERLKRIQNLELEVVFGARRWYSVPSTEEYNLYLVRDSVRKLVELFANGPVSTISGSSRYSLKRLTVKPFVGDTYHWASNEVLAALFLVLEPFHHLKVELFDSA
jgi:hypothetical protein